MSRGKMVDVFVSLATIIIATALTRCYYNKKGIDDMGI